MAVPTTIGARIRYWRRRRGGMTQAVLAGLSGVSQAYISQVESGRKVIDKRSTLLAIAMALKVSAVDLLGHPGDPADPAKARATSSVSAIRVALVEIEEGERCKPTFSIEQLGAGIARLSELRSRADYIAMAALLPALLTNAASYGRTHLARVGYEAATTLKNLGYRDLSLPAARVAVSGALDSENHAWVGATRYFHSIAIPLEVPATASRIAGRALNDLQEHASDPAARQMLGQLHLSAALTCAVAGRTDNASDHLRAAKDEARTLGGGDPGDGVGFNLLGFGPTNIMLWEMSIAAELGEFGRVVELAKKCTPGPLKMADRHYSYWLTLGRALANLKADAERPALVAFMRAERAAPMAFALNPHVRDTIASMVARAQRRSIPDDLRVLARRTGIEVE